VANEVATIAVRAATASETVRRRIRRISGG
jgi:hypothetical protein